MKKEYLIKDSLKKLMLSESLNEITVKKLCSLSNVKRQTFYYHFQDIYDVLASIYLNEKINNVENAKNWADLIHYILLYVDTNRQIVVKTLKSGAKDVIESFFYNNLYSNGINFIKKNYGNTISFPDIRDISKLIADTLSREICRLLLSYKELSIAEIEDKIDVMFDGVLDLICDNKMKRR